MGETTLEQPGAWGGIYSVCSLPPISLLSSFFIHSGPNFQEVWLDPLGPEVQLPTHSFTFSQMMSVQLLQGFLTAVLGPILVYFSQWLNKVDTTITMNLVFHFTCEVQRHYRDLPKAHSW